MFFNSLPSAGSRALGKADPTLGKEPTQTLNHATSHSTPHLSIRAPLPIHTRRRFALATAAALLHAAGRAPHQHRQAPPPLAFPAASFASCSGSPPPPRRRLPTPPSLLEASSLPPRCLHTARRCRPRPPRPPRPRPRATPAREPRPPPVLAAPGPMPPAARAAAAPGPAPSAGKVFLVYFVSLIC